MSFSFQAAHFDLSVLCHAGRELHLFAHALCTFADLNINILYHV